MQAAQPLTPKTLVPFLLSVAPVPPVFGWALRASASRRWGRFAESVGLPCVSVLGSQLAPGDIIGVLQIIESKPHLCPPCPQPMIFGQGGASP